MKYDVIVIGAGFGGLTCATKLAKSGRKVLLLEKAPHIGGTSYVFKREGYTFPMGPLSFGYPLKVREYLEELGIDKKIGFHRSHFQLICPFFDLIYSRPFTEFKESLKKTFPEEKKIGLFFSRFEEIINLVKDVPSWHPDYALGKRKKEIIENAGSSLQIKMKRVKALAGMTGRAFLDAFFSNEHIINLLGSMGTRPPRMSLLNLALMWNIMSIEGIWFPSCGIHGLMELIKNAYICYGGELRTGFSVEKILVKNGIAEGVRGKDGHLYPASWIVSNADYKKTFFELIDEGRVRTLFLEGIGTIPYTHSELCVYLGVDPQKMDLTAMRAPHLFYRHDYEPASRPELEDFGSREMEICLWSDKMAGLTPENMAALVMRVGFPYDHFARFRTGDKRRREDYAAYKKRLALSLVRTAENILPGLSSAIQVMETATPLTYRDWGHRYGGSIAGWTWKVKKETSAGEKFLVVTPVSNLVMAGIYAAAELFLGGIPTAMHTGSLAADWILEKETDPL